MRRVAGAVLLCVGLGAPAAACGGDAVCEIAGGAYRIVLPGAVSGARVPAVMMLHGFRDSAAGMVAYPDLAASLGARGIALIAPDGRGGGWSVPGAPPRERDDVAFLEAVLDDAAARFPVARERVILAGFSLGASMAWTLACRRGERFRGVVAVAGAFWDPIPESCASPTPRLVHIHGLADRTVPMEGRMVRSGYRQGDVWASLGVWRARCPAAEASVAAEGPFTCRRWTCQSRPLELCLHAGGHDLDGRWIAEAVDRLARAER
jgi:polyhydroxybutyrate depolymerase